MKKSICLIILLSVMSSVCLAGGSFKKEIHMKNPPPDVIVDTTPKPVEKIIVHEIEKPIIPTYGIGLGFRGDILCLAYTKPEYKLFVGGGRSNSDSRLLLRGQGKIADVYSIPVNLGVSLWPYASSHQSGISLGTERYITDNLSCQADLYLLKMGNVAPDIAVVEVGACLVLWK